MNIKDKKDENFVYILRCSDDTYYTGWTNNIEKRFLAHNTKKGAKYTKNRLPASLVYYEKYNRKEEAMKREYAIKQLSRNEKEKIICKCNNIFIKRKIEKINKLLGI